MWQCRGHAAQSEPRAGSAEEFGDYVNKKPTEQAQILSTAQAHREAGRGSCGMATALAQRAFSPQRMIYEQQDNYDFNSTPRNTYAGYTPKIPSKSPLKLRMQLLDPIERHRSRRSARLHAHLGVNALEVFFDGGGA
jgi:hypothetical protein